MIDYNIDGATLTIYDVVQGEDFTMEASRYISGDVYMDLADLMGWELAAKVRDCWNSTSAFPDDLERVGHALDGTRYAAYVDGVNIGFM